MRYAHDVFMPSLSSVASWLLILTATFFTPARSQVLSTAIPVYDKAGTPMLNPWAGGMSLPQFSSVNLDGDPLMDLVVFDREDATFTPYLNRGTEGEHTFVFAPEFQARYDSCDCFGWAKLIDANCDGLADVVCGTPTSNVKVYQQGTNESGEVVYELTYDPLRSLYSSGVSPLFSGKLDVPAVIDVDGDGDLDFLTWANGFDYMEWHRNMAREYYDRCDTIELELNRRCWGHFREVGFEGEFIMEDTLTNPCLLGDFSPARGEAPTGERHAGGTSTLLVDLNQDGLLDALIGDADNNDLAALYNGGTPTYAYMDSLEYNFPSTNLPVDLRMFPAAFELDANNDGYQDLVIAPNQATSELVENTEGVQLYLQERLDEMPAFVFSEQGFLQSTQIELGNEAVPHLFDYNQDGLLDLLVGNRGYHVDFTDALIPALSLFENVGTAERPAFQLVDDDFLGIRASEAFPLLQHMVPTSADIDADGDQDLFIGAVLGDIYFFENTTTAGGAPTFAFITDDYGDVKVRGNAAPTFYDFDEDGDLDLWVGDKGGYIHYYENTGTAEQARFELITDRWGFVEIEDEFGRPGSSVPPGFPRPVVVDYDQDDEVELLVGGRRGFIEIYEGMAQALTDTMAFVGTLFDYDVGVSSAVAVGTLDDTGTLTYILGNKRGGLQLFSALEETTTSRTPRQPRLQGVSVFPNPTRDLLFVAISKTASQPAQVTLTNQMGQRLRSEVMHGGRLQLDLAPLSSGIYFLRVVQGQAVSTHKVIKQ